MSNLWGVGEAAAAGGGGRDGRRGLGLSADTFTRHRPYTHARPVATVPFAVTTGIEGYPPPRNSVSPPPRANEPGYGADTRYAQTETAPLWQREVDASLAAAVGVFRLARRSRPQTGGQTSIDLGPTASRLSMLNVEQWRQFLVTVRPNVGGGGGGRLMQRQRRGEDAPNQIRDLCGRSLI